MLTQNCQNMQMISVSSVIYTYLNNCIMRVSQTNDIYFALTNVQDVIIMSGSFGYHEEGPHAHIKNCLAPY